MRGNGFRDIENICEVTDDCVIMFVLPCSDISTTYYVLLIAIDRSQEGNIVSKARYNIFVKGRFHRRDSFLPGRQEIKMYFSLRKDTTAFS